MEEELSTYSANAPRPKGKWRINISIFLFFLLLSAIFWLLNSLTRDYTTTIHYGVRYINPPKNRVVTGSDHMRLSILAKGHGYTLLRFLIIEKNTSLIVDLESTYYHRTASAGKVYYLSSGIKDAVQNQLGPDIQVLSILPDTIEISLTGSTKRKIKVIARLDIKLEKQYLLKGDPVCIPDSILVTGPASILDTLSFISTQMQQVKNVNKNLELMLPIKETEKLTFDITQVKVRLTAEKYTEAMLKVPIKVLNLPAGLKLKTFPHDATLVFNIPLSDYNKLSPSLFNIVVDYKDLVNKKSNKLDVIIKETPEFAYSLKCLPRTVEFIVER
jgi:hypothetical protein